MGREARRLGVFSLAWMVVLLSPRAGQAQPDAASTEGPYVYRQWTTEEGLPVNTVRDVAQGPQGYLWLATYAGLVRFDGVEFSTMTAANSALPTNRLQTLQVGPEGDLWGRTAGERIVQIDPWRHSVVGRYGQGAGGIPAPVYAAVRTDERLWLRTHRMLYASRRDEGAQGTVGWRAVLPDSMNVIAAHGGSGETLWVGTSQRGLWHVRSGTAEQVTIESTEGRRVESINEIAIRGDSVWVAGDDRLFRLEGDRFVALPPAAQILTGPPLSLKATANRLWVYRGSGVHVLEDGRARRVSGGPVGAQTVRTGPEGPRWTSVEGQVRRDGRPVLDTDGIVERLLRDREGGWWVATERDGLYRLRRTPITMVDADDGLPANNVYGVTPTRPDSSGVWVGAIGGGWSAFGTARWNPLPRPGDCPPSSGPRTRPGTAPSGRVPRRASTSTIRRPARRRPGSRESPTSCGTCPSGPPTRIGRGGSGSTSTGSSASGPKGSGAPGPSARRVGPRAGP